MKRYLEIRSLLFFGMLVLSSGCKTNDTGLEASSAMAGSDVNQTSGVSSKLYSDRVVPGYDTHVVDRHEQLFGQSCIPMSVEMVLKLTSRRASGFYDLQKPIVDPENWTAC